MPHHGLYCMLGLTHSKLLVISVVEPEMEEPLLFALAEPDLDPDPT
jgi:hypothetical protein